MKGIHLVNVLLLVLLASVSFGQRIITVTNNMVITGSGTIRKAEYIVRSPDSVKNASIIIDGDNITLDFNGAVLNGSSDAMHPERFTGTGILIRKGKNITIKNAIIKGFKVGLMARNITNLHIINCDLSYNFRQRLNSSRLQEDVTDWQSYHKNENDEWLRFGAGIYLSNCDSVEITGNTVTNGQCGLMMTNTTRSRVFDNTFSFNSGIGIGMYRSSHNVVINNKVNWNVRGFSFGIYYRGQDSAGILVYEQSSSNIFAYNSVTHSGDGFFLWAGQSTIDTGKGGCNDNLVYGNDFSFAPTNGIEITFSRNRIINNIVKDCWHAVWGGFSYNTAIVGNTFGGNLSAVAIEHGQENTIAQNVFDHDSLGIELWSTPGRKGEPGYMNNRDTRSRDYKIINNTFAGVKNKYSIKRTENVLISDTAEMISTKEDSLLVAKMLPRGMQPDALRPDAYPRGKQYIMMTEYGPYNFAYPMAWWTGTDSLGYLNIQLVGKAGSYKITKMTGVELVAGDMKGKVPATLRVRKNDSLVNIDFVYTGPVVSSPFGKKYKEGAPYLFSYREAKLPIAWSIKWYAFDSTADPVKNEKAFRAQLAGRSPVRSLDTGRLHFAWWTGLGKGLPRSSFATVANGTFQCKQGKYRISLSAGDLARVYVDGKLIIDSWNMKNKKFDADFHYDAEVSLANGKHRVAVEHAQYGGYGMLGLEILAM